MGHLGESQGHAQGTSPFELILKTQNQGKCKPSPEKERRQNPGCYIVADACERINHK